jgi:hypothetical protein
MSMMQMKTYFSPPLPPVSGVDLEMSALHAMLRRLWEERKGDMALPYAANMYRTVCVSLDVVALVCAFWLAEPADGYIVLILGRTVSFVYVNV